MALDEDLETWCDVADVYKLTGETVDEVVLTQAQGIMDLFSGTTFASRDNIAGRNLRHLLAATAYQAAWMPSHPDIFTHMDVQSIQAGGASATPGGENAQLLAPFALRALRRLTWWQKPYRTRGRYGTYNNDTPRDSAVADDNRPWTPIR